MAANQDDKTPKKSKKLWKIIGIIILILIAIIIIANVSKSPKEKAAREGSNAVSGAASGDYKAQEAAETSNMDIAVTNVIPERYALLEITGVDPASPLDKEKIMQIFTEQFEKANVGFMQLVIYDQGKEAGDGIRAFAEKNEKEKIMQIFTEQFEKANGSFMQLVIYDQGKEAGDGIRAFAEKNEAKKAKTGDLFEPTDVEQSKLYEKLLGYPITPKALHAIYSDNEVVADEDFKDKPLILEIKVPNIAKDAFGKAYLSIPVDQYGLSTLHIYLQEDDPYLRKIRKGSNIIVRAYPKSFIMESVMLDGEIVTVQ